MLLLKSSHAVFHQAEGGTTSAARVLVFPVGFPFFPFPFFFLPLAFFFPRFPARLPGVLEWRDRVEGPQGRCCHCPTRAK